MASHNAGRDLVTVPMIQEATQADGVWLATLALDLDDPYFFDHPLDHVPGTALVAGLLDLFRFGNAGYLERTDGHVTLSVKLHSFCELDSPVELEVTQLPVGDALMPTDAKGAMRALQDGRLVCSGDAIFTSLAPVPPVVAGEQPSFPQADQVVVHRHRPENVLVSGMVASGDTRLVAIKRPREGHRLAAAAGRPLQTEAIIDAGRQFATMIWHLEFGSSAETKFILVGILAELPCAPEPDLFLRYTCTPQSHGRSSLIIDVVGGAADGDPCGRLTFDCFTVSPAVYRHLRRSGGAR